MELWLTIYCRNVVIISIVTVFYYHLSGTSIVRSFDSSPPTICSCLHILPPNWISVRSRLNEIRTWESRPVPSNIGRKLWRVRDWRGGPQWHCSCCRCCTQYCHKLCNGVYSGIYQKLSHISCNDSRLRWASIPHSHTRQNLRFLWILFLLFVLFRRFSFLPLLWNL